MGTIHNHFSFYPAELRSVLPSSSAGAIPAANSSLAPVSQSFSQPFSEWMSSLLGEIQSAPASDLNLLSFLFNGGPLSVLTPSANVAAAGSPPDSAPSTPFPSLPSPVALDMAVAIQPVTSSPVRVSQQSPAIVPETEPGPSPAPNLTAAQQQANELAEDYATPGSLASETLNQQLNDPRNPWFAANGGAMGNSTIDYATPGNADFGTPGNPVAAAFTGYNGPPTPSTTIPPNPNA